MNKENFTDYLKEVANLYKVSYEELKTLVVEYPYCQNLHHLLLEKSKLDDSEHFEANLHRAATYSSNRAHLFFKLQRLVQPLAQEESVLAREEYLELPDLQNPGKELPQLIERSADNAPPPLALTFIREDDHDLSSTRTPVSPPPSFLPPDETEPVAAQEPKEKKASKAVTNPPSPSNVEPLTFETIDAVATALRVLDTNFFRPRIFKQGHSLLRKGANHRHSKHTEEGPRPKASFPSWVQQFQPSHVKLKLSELMEAKKHEDNKSSKKTKNAPVDVLIEQVIAQSVRENQELASETLAELLTAQMQYTKAIQVYERLSLKFPQKSPYFAEKISNLKKLMI